MPSSDEQEPNISRRALLKGAAALAGVTLLPVSMLTGTAKAANKLPKSAVKYQDHPNGNKQCSKCIQFIPSQSKGGKSHCKVVKGDILPKGYCIAFVAKQ